MPSFISDSFTAGLSRHCILVLVSFKARLSRHGFQGTAGVTGCMSLGKTGRPTSWRHGMIQVSWPRPSSWLILRVLLMDTASISSRFTARIDVPSSHLGKPFLFSAWVAISTREPAQRLDVVVVPCVRGLSTYAEAAAGSWLCGRRSQSVCAAGRDAAFTEGDQSFI